MLADEVIIGLNTDEFITEYKGSPPIMSYEERKAVLEGCKYVTKVIPNVGGQDSKPAILNAEADIVAIGSDWAGRDYYKQMDFTQEWLDESGIVLIYLPYFQGVTTTEIKRRLRS
jgi:glycerol-3-phosphate cytidylyltransferase-like family protein